MDPLLRKLKLVDQTPVLIISAPDEMKPLFAGREVDEHHAAKRKYAFLLAFVRNLEEARHIAGNLVSAYMPGGFLWVAYPKGTSEKYKSEISDDSLWSALAPYDFEPVTEVSLKDDWYAIRFQHADEVKMKIKKTAPHEKGTEENEERKIEDVENLISHGHVIP
jgi:hypothetical protein